MFRYSGVGLLAEILFIRCLMPDSGYQIPDHGIASRTYHHCCLKGMRILPGKSARQKGSIVCVCPTPAMRARRGGRVCVSAYPVGRNYRTGVAKLFTILRMGHIEKNSKIATKRKQILAHRLVPKYGILNVSMISLIVSFDIIKTSSRPFQLPPPAVTCIKAS